MASSLGGTYDSGLLTVVNGSLNVHIEDALLTTQALKGDWLYIPSANRMVFVEEVTDDENLVLQFAWDADTQTAVGYLLIKMSWSRYDPAITQQKVRELLTFYEGIGFFYFVEGDEPDDGIGKEGQYAIKVNGGAWKLWYFTGGLWVFQGSAAGIDLQGLYSPLVTYNLNAGVTWQGSLYASKVGSNIGHQPDTSPTQWQLLTKGGDRYDVQFFDTDRPASGELINKLYPVGVSFYVGVSQSYASAEVAATATCFYSYRKNGVEFARLTFNPGSLIGVFTCPVLTTFGAGDKFTQYAPALRDETLSGIGGNLIGFRS